MHVGVWGLASIVIVIVSWLQAGVFQAFIIDFYAGLPADYLLSDQSAIPPMLFSIGHG